MFSVAVSFIFCSTPNGAVGVLCLAVGVLYLAVGVLYLEVPAWEAHPTVH